MTVDPISALKGRVKTALACRSLTRPFTAGRAALTRPFTAETATTFSRLLRLVVPFKGRVVLSVLLGFATVGSGVGLMATSAFIIASAALHPSVADLAVAIVGVRFFGISRAVFRYLERYVSHDVNFRLLAALRVQFYRALEPLAPARLLQHRSGDLLARAVADVETLQNFYVRVVAPPLVAALAALALGLFMARFDAGLASTLLAFMLLAGVGVPLLVHRLGLGLGRRTAKVRSNLSAQLVDGLQGMADLVAFGQETAQAARVGALNRDWAAAQGRMARVAALHNALSGLLANLGMVAVLVVAIPLVGSGRLEGIFLPVLALAALAGFEAVAPLPLAFQHLEGSLESGRRLFDILDEGMGKWRSQTNKDVQDMQDEVVENGPCSSFLPPTLPVPDLVVEDLRFRYGPGEPLALDGVGFELARGGRLAIVGPSGAGKSTLVHLLLRFWDYQEGHITLDGRELRCCDPEEVRRLVGVVSQRTHLFNATIRENLLIARPDATEGEMVRAAEMAALHGFVQTLPHGYDTYVGEQGLQLSGGERQRIAIARALLKDAPLLILDEATANLDSLTEREVLGAIHALMEGRSTLIVTHRLVGLESADEILVLRAGRVVERGRHAELLERDGLYRRMWDLQRQLLPSRRPFPDWPPHRV